MRVEPLRAATSGVGGWEETVVRADAGEGTKLTAPRAPAAAGASSAVAGAPSRDFFRGF